DLVGTDIFIGALKMIVAPLIFFSILAGITSLPTKGELWSIGWRTLVFYLITTSIAVAIGLIFVLTIQPGSRDPERRAEVRESWEERQAEIVAEYSAKEERVGEVKGRSAGETIRENVRRIIMNPFQALSTMNSLGIIFFAIVLGIALIMVGSLADPVLPVIEGVNAAIMMITRWIMWGAPFFIFCLVTSLAAKYGPQIFRTLSWYVVTVLIGIACHVCILLAICRFAGRLSPWTFLKGIRRAWAVAFATRSSAATLPVTIDCVENEVGVPRKVADFVLPIGATMNMDGTALYEGVAVIFLIQLFGGMPGVPIELTPVMTGIVFITAVLASIGAAAVPDAGLVTMVLVAGAIGLDASYIVLVFAVDAFLDMFRTSTNVMGDSVGAVVVARLSGEHVPGTAA
ncbi:MAG: dicarboxylate/amino acid:cation symporter, partial [Planctomycetota bacterium]